MDFFANAAVTGQDGGRLARARTFFHVSRVGATGHHAGATSGNTAVDGAGFSQDYFVWSLRESCGGADDWCHSAAGISGARHRAFLAAPGESFSPCRSRG
jgi:hypothetical protein